MNKNEFDLREKFNRTSKLTLKSILLNKKPPVDGDAARIKSALALFSKKNDLDWENLKNIESRKELAQNINANELNMAYLMWRYSKKCVSYKDYLDIHVKNNKTSSAFLEALLFSLKGHLND